MDAELRRLDAVAQAGLVRRGVVSARELVRSAVERIERDDPRLNAVVAPLFDEALRAASSRPRGPLAGVPFLMKDLGAVQAGQPYYAGNRALRDASHRAAADSPLGARLRASGLITLGKTSTPEFGLQSTTQPLAFGPTRNPVALDRSAGGSSGGSCAAVAAGLVPVAHASDGGGSIRIPAAWCGVVGFKPSRGRIGAEPGAAASVTEFAVSRTVRDAGALLRVLGERGGAGAADAELAAAARGLRVGLLDAAPSVSVHGECVAAVRRTGRLLESLGHRVEPAHPPALFEEERAWRGLASGTAEYRACLRELAVRLGRAVGPDDVEPFLWSVAHLDARAISTGERRAHARAEARWIRRVCGWWSEFDLLVTPTVCEPAPALSELEAPADRPWRLLERIGAHLIFTEPWNATGQPAVSLPLHRAPDGRPVGVQLIAAPGRDELLLSVSAELEQAAPWPGGAAPGPLPALRADEVRRAFTPSGSVSFYES